MIKSAMKRFVKKIVQHHGRYVIAKQSYKVTSSSEALEDCKFHTFD